MTVPVESCRCHAIQAAQRQGPRLSELRAMVSLAPLTQTWDKRADTCRGVTGRMGWMNSRWCLSDLLRGRMYIVPQSEYSMKTVFSAWISRLIWARRKMLEQ